LSCGCGDDHLDDDASELRRGHHHRGDDDELRFQTELFCDRGDHRDAAHDDEPSHNPITHQFDGS